MSTRIASPVEQIMAELQRTHPDAFPVRNYPRTREDYDHQRAERRAEDRTYEPDPSGRMADRAADRYERNVLRMN